MTSFPIHRPYTRWVLRPYVDPNTGADWVTESASVPYIIESLGTYAEIASIGRARFVGTVAQKNVLYQDFRNYLRQALSNFTAAQSVPNRSAGLLYYYAALNFAKAELLDRHSARLVNKGIGHGLSFNPTNAKTVSGDQLTVKDGVFPLLYERRTGDKLPIGTKLPINRLLLQVPEISSQVRAAGAAGGGGGHVSGVLVMFAMDETHSWTLLALSDDTYVARGNQSPTSKLFNQHFSRVQTPPGWRDNFGISRRLPYSFSFYESIVKMPITAAGENYALASLRNVKAILGTPTNEEFDAWLTPSMYKTRMLPMPPSLARYALTYYASSLVRYKPQMFDGRSFPEQAYLFDAIARELALPMLQDVLNAVQQQTVIFHRAGSMRV